MIGFDKKVAISELVEDMTMFAWLSLRSTQVSFRTFQVIKPRGRNSSSNASCSVLPTTTLMSEYTFRDLPWCLSINFLRKRCVPVCWRNWQTRDHNHDKKIENLGSLIVIISHCLVSLFWIKSFRPNPCDFIFKLALFLSSTPLYLPSQTVVI